MKNRTLHIVTIGGGTGSFTLLSGLKKYPVHLSAIVSMADDGGSTGKLRDELGVLPPGDARQCLVALSKSSDMVRKLFNYRFESGNLKGHTVGNLFLSALEKMTGNFENAVIAAARILNVSGEIIPVTTSDARLFMQLRNNRLLKGEHAISNNSTLRSVGVRRMFFKPRVTANPRALRNIKNADLVVIGPGNHYGSIIPNLLIKGIARALRETRATVVYVCNVSNKRGHTDNYSAADYIAELHTYIGSPRIDYAAVNTQQPSPRLMKKYAKTEGKNFLVSAAPSGNVHRTKIIKEKLLNPKPPTYNKADSLAHLRSFIRHDSDKLARVIMGIARGSKRNR